MDDPRRDLDAVALEALAKRLGQDARIAAAYLLGSAAAGRLRADSDVDVALLMARGVAFSGRERAELAADLETIVGRPVDLGVLHTGNLIYAKEAVACGKLLFERDRAARARFAMLALSMYASLQETRREVLRAYAA